MATTARACRPAATRVRYVRREACLATAGLLAAVLAAGCAGPDRTPEVATARTSPPVASSPSAPADPRSALLRFVGCMRGAGVDLDDPAPDGRLQLQPGDKTDPEFPKAFQQCKILLPNEGAPAPPSFSPEQLEKMRRYAQCIRDNGVPDFADPGPQGFVTAPRDPVAAERAYRICGPIVGADPRQTGGAG
ncbi:MAG TPA: hypothetical protein VFM55_17815 [Micromonosporaceae bacterium]|nr:hypothetical protein [Micromonosporaceae bacterium]